MKFLLMFVFSVLISTNAPSSIALDSENNDQPIYSSAQVLGSWFFFIGLHLHHVPLHRIHDNRVDIPDHERILAFIIIPLLFGAYGYFIGYLIDNP